MKFTTMHGLGNDYVYVDAREEHPTDPAELARRVSDRHTGIGSDGLILIQPSRVAHVRMEMYNADGSRAQMCGNGIRCVAKFAVERGLTPGPELMIETDAGVRRAMCFVDRGYVNRVRVDMGKPSLDPESLPSTIRGDRVVDHPLRLDDFDLRITCVSMGNPHAVAFVDDLEAINLAGVGSRLENAAEFPERINAHFVQVDNRAAVTMKTWERGSGATRACGTGACAVCVAGSVTGRTDRKILARLPGGELELEWAADDHVYMTGPAVEVFTGDWPSHPIE